MLEQKVYCIRNSAAVDIGWESRRMAEKAERQRERKGSGIEVKVEEEKTYRKVGAHISCLVQQEGGEA